MTSTTILSEDTATIVSDDQGRSFNWGAVIAGAIAAAAVIFFLSTLGSGIGLAYAAHDGATGTRSFLTLAAIYFFASQAFGFTIGGYLVGRLIGPEAETTREEEFRSAAHGFVMWSLVVVVSLAYTPVDAEQKFNRTFGLLSVRRPKIPGLLTLAWPALVWFTERIFAEDRQIVELEQLAHDQQGADWNQEVFPVIRDLRALLAANGLSDYGADVQLRTEQLQAEPAG